MEGLFLRTWLVFLLLLYTVSEDGPEQTERPLFVMATVCDKNKGLEMGLPSWEATALKDPC